MLRVRRCARPWHTSELHGYDFVEGLAPGGVVAASDALGTIASSAVNPGGW